jgi:hypothetical protein
MPFVRYTSSAELVRRWQDEKRQILDAQAPEVKKAIFRYLELDRLIREVRRVDARRKREFEARMEAKAAEEGGSRVPLTVHKKKLIDFLREHGPSVRAEIANKTGIPPGSLSELLSSSEFEQLQRGFWGLKKPGTSAPPAK